MPFNPTVLTEGFENSETLAELRTALLVRLGYAAQAASPPPGMAPLLTNFLQRSQAYLYRRYKALKTERYFEWDMVVGERFYTVLEDSAVDSPGVVNPRLSASRITWAGVEDLNGTWYDLLYGIPAGFYTTVTQNGMPSRYEVRQGIEVFPAPDSAYKLRIKGHFGLLPFGADTDVATINSELLFLWALANAKNHYGQPDAADIATQAQTMLRDLISESHGTRRYVPGTSSPAPLAKPLFVDLDP